jgi:transcriptional regulator with XRE-family HTH domain
VSVATVSGLRLRASEYPGPQYVLAARCGIHPTTFSEYCRGTRVPSNRHLAAMAEVLGCPAEELLEQIKVSPSSTPPATAT